ncbi:response regulator [Flavobacterium sp.]|jgi:DNA-binding NarL/FixJ family response regulator|uniref:response regulator n=1 Tax=Flavobacterium sp. TaxID=239 RepID=UPI0037C04E08
MFKKVIIAEDFDSINLAVMQVLSELGVTEIHHAKYCDDAQLKIKKAILDNEPFDLLISDLSFRADHRKVQLVSGDDLIKWVREAQPDLKIIVHSVEDKTFHIKSLFENQNIDGFVIKGRRSIHELKTAIKNLFQTNEKYISPEMEHLLQDKTINEIDNFDIELIKQLSLGVPQEKMDIKFKELGITPSSKSTIEKRIGKLKDYFKANNTVHLISIAKDLGIA